MSKLSAYEKRQAVYNKISQDIYNNRLKRLQETAQQEQAEANQNKHWLERGFETVGDFFGNVISGASKAMEGIYDFGASIVGGIGGIFDQGFQDRVKEHIAYDWTTENISNPLNDYFSGSYLNDGDVGRFIENVASGVGQMLPSVAMNIVAPGSGMVTLGLSATGSGTEEAFKDGAGYYQGMGYGALSGAVEMATEKLGAKLFGTSAIDDALGIKSGKTLFKEATTKGGKILQGMASEGLEEGVAELVSPLSKTIYKGTDSLKEYKDKEFWGRVGESALVGAGTSLVFGETVGRINRNTNNAREALSELKTLEIKEENLHANGKLFEGGNQQKIDKLRSKYQAELSESVSKMKEDKRAEFIKQNNLSSILNPDGSLITNTESSSLTNNSNELGVNKGLASGLDNRYYSVKLKGRESSIAEGLAKQGIEVYKGELTATEQKNYNRFKNVMLALSRKGLVRSNFVVSNQSTKFDAYLDGDTAVFGKQLFENEDWQGKLIHEIEHFTEGSKEWVDYANFLLKESNLNKANQDILSKGYGITQTDIDTLAENINKNKLTDKQRLYLSEVIATQSEFLFGNEQAIERLTAEKRNLAQKIYDKIKNFIQVLKAKTPEERQMIRKLQKAEQLFEKALSKAGTEYLVKQSIDSKNKNIYNEETKFARKTATYIPYNKIGDENVSAIRQSLRNIYGNFDNCVADGIAIEKGNTIYVVDSGKENGELRFGIRNTIKISDETLRKERMVKINDRAIQDGFISEQLFGKIRGSSNKYSRGSIGQQLQEELSIDTRESTNNQERVSKQDADRRRVENSKPQFSLAKKIKGIDEKAVPIKLQSAIVDFVVKDVDNRLKEIQKSIKQNEQLLAEGKVPPALVETFKNDLKELKENERKSLLQQKSIQEQRRTFDDNSNQEWELPNPYSERLREITQVFGIQENNKAKRFLIDVINSAKLYKDYPIKNVANGYTVGNLTESIRIVDYDCLPKNLVDLKQENEELGIRTWFFVDTGYQSVDVGGFYVPNEGKIFLLLDDSNKPFNLVNRHEKTHYFEREYPDLYKFYKEEVNKVLTQEEQNSLYEKYFSKYKEEYSSISIDKADIFEEYIWGEVYANIYSLVEIDSIKGRNEIYNINENFDNKLKEKFNINHDIQYSLKDSQGNTLTESQAEFFKDSKVRDENGNLQVVYHGTRSNNDFTEFDKKHISKWNAFGDGFYFTDNYERAVFYGRTNLFKTYINIKNPLYTNNKKQIDMLLNKLNIKREDVESFAKENYLDGSDLFLLRHYIDGSEYVGEKINANIAEAIKELGFDGIISFGFDNNEYVVFESNQIKQTTNLRPTLDNDIRFSLSNNDDLESFDPLWEKYFDSLTKEEFNALIKDDVEELPLSKEDRRQLYVEKLYNENKLNDVVTKIVNKNPQMKEFFKDTQMNMKYNPLSMLQKVNDEFIVMFHGTPNTYFNVFDASHIGDNGSVMGEGFYFTASLEYAKDYKEKHGRVIATLLDIKKPLSRNKITISKNELKTFIQDVVVKYKKNYLQDFNGDIDSAVDYWFKNYDNDVDLIQKLHENTLMFWEDFYSGLRDTIGYDGVIAWNKAEGTQAIVFNSNQIKEIFNYKPTKNPDIRYSLSKDNKGNFLTESQEEYFKDSKVRDENNNLLLVHHGTDAEFYTFDRNRIGKGTDQFGAGFYFAESKEASQSYGKRVMDVYLNITKPIVINRSMEGGDLYDVKITKEQAYKILKKHPKMYDPEESPLGDFVPEYWDEGAQDYMIREMAESYTNIGLLDGDRVAFREYPNELHEAIREILGYDGVEVRFDNTDKKFYVAWFENQIKDINNLNPTTNKDIRFSLRHDSNGEELSKEQIEFFKDSKIRDNNGNLLVLYHGSKSSFNIFDISKSGESSKQAKVGFWFTENKQGASNFANDIWYGESDKEVVYSVYLNIKNPKIYETYKIDENLKTKLKNKIKDFEDKIHELNLKYSWMKTNYDISMLFNSMKREINRKSAKYDKEHFKQLTKNLNISNMFDEMWKDAKNIIVLEKQKQIAENNYHKYKASDAYEQFRTDLYLSAGMTAEEANVGGIGMAMANSNEEILKFVNSLKEHGYDGIIIKNTEYDRETLGEGNINNQYVAFYPNQIKNIDNKKPTLNEDIRYSLSKGQVSKLRANYANPKVYSREDAERVVNEILGNGILELEDKFGSMKGKTKAEAIDKMFITLNKVEPGKRADLVRDMAEFVVNNATYEDIYEDDTLTEQVRVYETLKEYRGKLNLDYIKDEIKHRFDNKAGGIVLQWGKQKGKFSLEIDSVAQELRELGVDISATNPADQLFEIIDLYTEARNAIKNKVDKYNIESFENSSREKAIEEAIREIYAGLDKYGEKSKFTERVEKYTERIKQLSERIKENFNAYRLTNVVLDKVQNIKNWKMGTFLNASKYKTEAFKKSIEALSNIKFRGNINKSGTRKILTGLNSFYDKQNPILGYQQDADGATVFCYYNEEVKFMLEELSKNSNTELSVQELGYLSKVLDYFKNFLENYNKIYRNGKFVDALPIAQKHVEQLQKNKAVKVGWWSNIFNKIFNNPKASYLQTFGDPMTVARYFDKYEDGFYTEMLGKLREGAINASVLEMEIREKLDSFLEKHKDFGKLLKNRTIKYENFEIPAQKAFLLYMTLNREQAQLGLANSGFSFEDANGVIQSVDGFNKEGSTSQWEISKMAQEVRKQLESQFTDTEKEYIKIAEKIFNEDCKEAKRETDILRTGYSNVIEDYYVPIHRANIAKKIDTNLYQEMDRVSNASFNKDTKQGAQGELFINSLENVLDRHIRAVSQYAKLSTVIEEFDILYNLDILDNSNKPVNVKSESVNTWRDGYKYFKNLLSDMQGIPRGETNKIVAFLRSGFAKFQLGANPKVWATQFSSLFASSSILDYDSLVKGFSVSGKDVDNYCKLAKLRNYDNSAVLAQSVMDKVDKVGDFLMKPIGKTDRLVIKKLFGACQVQVEKNSGLKIGTEENKVKAGELLTKVILETQQNSLATERSNAMRSGSEFMKAITMFTADAMKMVGRFIDGLGEYSILRAKIKQSTDAKEIESLKAKLKKAKGKVVKSSVALTSSAVFMALIAQAFKWLYNKDKEDENVIENMVVDAFGNMLGGLPLIKDLYGKFAEGYDLNNYAYSAINDVLDSFNNLMNFDSKKPGQIVRDLVYALGQVLGLPARNIYNIAYGLTSKISPELGYKMNDLFYKQNYSSDLKKAIKSDDDTMISTIVDMMLNDRVGNLNNEKAQKTISELVKKGYAVLPKNVSDTITYDGESIELTKRQKENFTKIYSQANDKVSSLTNGKNFENLPAEVKAKSIKYIYDYYYEEALKDLLGVDSDNKRYLFAQAIDIVKLAKIVAQVSQVEADTDKNGKVVSGSRKAKITQIVNSMNLTAVQKYMLMGYFGYKNAKGEKQVKSYIQSLKLTKTEKETLFKMCGY